MDTWTWVSKRDFQRAIRACLSVSSSRDLGFFVGRAHSTVLRWAGGKVDPGDTRRGEILELIGFLFSDVFTLEDIS